MIQRIITHPGGAHKDDALAVCVLIATHGAPISRREPTSTELADPHVAIVDIGGMHEPELMNFDHHQFPRDHVPTCALSLLLAHMGLYEDARHFCDWLEPAEWFDSRGPQKTAQFLSVPRKSISQLNSPVDITLLSRFSSRKELNEGDPLYEFMRFVGEDLLTYLRTIRERIVFVSEHLQHWDIQCAEEQTIAIFLPRTEVPVQEPNSTLKNYIRAKGLDDDVSAIVYPDGRSDGYGLARYEDHPSLDFSRVESEPDVHFAHKSGFMCKTSTTDSNRLRELIAASWKISS